MELRNVVLTEADYGRLQQLIESTRRAAKENTEYLEQGLEHATVVKSEEIPSDVMTMNSCARLKDLNSGHEFIYQIVFPRDADIAENRISVLAPIGTALLGLAAGSTIELQAPSGMRRFRILGVVFQPEAAGLAA